MRVRPSRMIAMRPSSLPAKIAPPGEIATVSVSTPCRSMSCTSARRASDQRLIVPSSLDEISSSPASVNATEITSARCPRNAVSRVPLKS